MHPLTCSNRDVPRPQFEVAYVRVHERITNRLNEGQGQYPYLQHMGIVKKHDYLLL